MSNKLKAKTIKRLLANLVVSNLHKNSKVCEMIAGARNFFFEFFDQRAPFARPIPIKRGSRKKIREYKMITNDNTKGFSTTHTHTKKKKKKKRNRSKYDHRRDGLQLTTSVMLV